MKPKSHTNPIPHFYPIRPHDPFLLAADLDGTLLGDAQGEAWLRAFALRYPGSFYLAFVTGRTLSSILELVDRERLPRPAFMCGNVGTELVDLGDPDNALGKKYVAQVPAGWDPEGIYALGEGPGVFRQEYPEGQPPFQAGFDWDGKPETLADFYRRMGHHDEYRLLPSHGMYIDVLPTPLGKGKAVQFLQQELGLDPARVVVAGDAGNDLEMFETGFQGILPANALEELRTAACQPWHYHSPLPAGRGVIDGLLHFGFIRQEKE